MATERDNAFVFFGPRALIGPELKSGDKAPDFSLLNGTLEGFSLSSFAGKPLLISVVPSLDTGVCTKQSVRFNQEAGMLGDKATFLTVSADLPFAQARWCGANDAANAQVLSDYRDMAFAQAYGTYIKDIRLNSRAVFVIDANGVVRYAEYVPTAGQEPNYDGAIDALKDCVA